MNLNTMDFVDRRRRGWPAVFLIVASLLAEPAAAHSFGRVYTLPVPYWMYAYGACAALILSFVVVGLFVRPPAPRNGVWERHLALPPPAKVLRWLLQALMLGLFALSIVSGWLGSRDPYRNFNMTFFWLVFLLGYGYLCALLGGSYAALNPWQTLCRLIAVVWRGYLRGWLHYPAALGYWPALAFYMALIGIELFLFNRPYSLSNLLAVWTGITLVGVALIGARDWFRYCDVLGLYFRLISLMAPLYYDARVEGGPRWRLRAPFAGLLRERPEHASLLLFALFMLSSTAFDGLRATKFWFSLFWGDRFQILTPLLGQPPILDYVRLRSWYVGYEAAWLLLSPFLYFAVYLFFVWLGRLFAGSRRATLALALDFGYSLLPIALVYNVTHYYTLLLSQGVKLISLLSDPLGWGWNLFGTAQRFRAPILPDMWLVWHSQVGLILFGHVVSVYIAHRIALARFGNAKQALLSQLPMLLLMLLFTASGLWILSQPLQSPGG